MKEIFINKTKCSKKEYNMFLKANDKHYGWREDLFLVSYFLFFVWFLINVIIYKIYMVLIFFIIISVIIFSYKILRPYFAVKSELKSKKIKNEEINTFNFYKYYFKVKNNEGESNIVYLKIYKVLENDTHFYIYITKTRAFLVSKQGFVKGSSEDFSKFLRKRVWFRYKNKKTNS